MTVLNTRRSVVSVEFTRPANTTAYAVGDIVSNSTVSTTILTFSNVLSAGGKGKIVGVTVSTDEPSLTPEIRLHVYSQSTPTLAVDNAAFIELYADAAKKVGYIDLAAMTSPASASGDAVSRTQNMSLNFPVKTSGSSKNLYGVLETRSTFTPASAQKFLVTVYVEID